MSSKKTTETEKKPAVSDASISNTFPLFVLLESLGQYTWDPGNNSNELLKPHSEVAVSDVLARLPSLGTDTSADFETLFERLNIVDKKVPLLSLSGIRFPVTLRMSLPAQNYPNQFPNDAGYIVPLFVALRRGMVLDEIDFVLGGSSLEFLAQRRAPEGSAVYLAQRVRNVILLTKNNFYIQNYADMGFQFERLLTGAGIADKHDIVQHESLQIMQIGNFKVLFSAEVDAVDEHGRCVEIKSGNPRYFGTKVMFQMISSGSNMLVQADKRGTTLVGIEKRSIHDVISEHPRSLCSRLQDSIISGLSELKSLASQVLEDFPSEVGFGGAMTLRPRRDLSVLPSKVVVHKLLEVAQRSTLRATAEAIPGDLTDKKT